MARVTSTPKTKAKATPTPRKKTTTVSDDVPAENTAELLADLQRKSVRIYFKLWIVGETPLIAHAWSEKAKREMLQKQLKIVGEVKAPRNPDLDFRNSLYKMPTREEIYGFPVLAFKKAIVGVAHKDKGIAKTNVSSALWVDGEMVRTQTAHAGAICDMPMIRLYSGKPEMREDAVKIGAIKKTATLAYRAQFTNWAVQLSGKLTTNVVPLDALRFLINESGYATGVGEWRNEKSGMFGAFHLASEAEAAAWDKFAFGKGQLPVWTPPAREAA